MTCTSMPQQWHKPRGFKIQSQPVTSLIVAKPKKVRKREPVSTKVTKQRYCTINNLSISCLVNVKCEKATGAHYVSLRKENESCLAIRGQYVCIQCIPLENVQSGQIFLVIHSSPGMFLIITDLVLIMTQYNLT